MNILSGKVFAAQLKEEAKRKVEMLQTKYNVTPGLAVIIVGNDPASEIYVTNKEKGCTETGIYSKVIRMPEDIDKEDLLTKIYLLNRDKKIHGILVQLPLPKQIRSAEAEILEAISPLKDVDGFHPINVGNLSIGKDALVPCTPHGCIRMLEKAGIKVAGKHAVIIGRSNIVGKPMAQLLLSRNATVTVCHSRTKNLAEITRQADILVAAVGRPYFVTADMVKKGAVVIDVGINRLENKKLVGDVDFDKVAPIAGAITPVPGGVGLLTIAMLMQNTVFAAELQVSSGEQL
jgi:methylenetetrahydrofolate dehydrogenase (NADP+)/methenyltetrahydrofolate cyclohydrolase